MSFIRALVGATLAMLAAVTAVRAEAIGGPGGALGLGMQVGTALVMLLAALIALSVAAKLLIVLGVVPRRPENAIHSLVHAMANFVGGLARPRPRRRDDPRHDGRRDKAPGAP